MNKMMLSGFPSVILDAAQELQKNEMLVDVYLQPSKEEIMDYKNYMKARAYESVSNILLTNKGFPAHKVLLAAASPFLKRLFEEHYEEHREKLITLLFPETPALVLQYVLLFIYTGNLKIPPSLYEEVLALCRILELSPLIHILADVIRASASSVTDTVWSDFKFLKQKKMKYNVNITPSSISGNVQNDNTLPVPLLEKINSRFLITSIGSSSESPNKGFVSLNAKLKAKERIKTRNINPAVRKPLLLINSSLRHSVPVSLCSDNSCTVLDQDYSATLLDTSINRRIAAVSLEGMQKLTSAGLPAVGLSSTSQPTSVSVQSCLSNSSCLIASGVRPQFSVIPLQKYISKPLPSKTALCNNHPDNTACILPALKSEDINRYTYQNLGNEIFAHNPSEEIGYFDDLEPNHNREEEEKKLQVLLKECEGIDIGGIRNFDNKKDAARENANILEQTGRDDLNELQSVEELNAKIDEWIQDDPLINLQAVPIKTIQKVLTSEGDSLPAHEIVPSNISVKVKSLRSDGSQPCSVVADGRSKLGDNFKEKGAQLLVDSDTDLVTALKSNENDVNNVNEHTLPIYEHRTPDELVTGKKFELSANLTSGPHDNIESYTQQRPRALGNSKVTLAYKDCSIVRDSKKALRTHVRKHQRNKGFNCTVCGKKFMRRNDCRTHELRHQEPTMPCKICLKPFKVQKDLNAHMTHHSDDKFFECDRCHKKLKTRRNLRMHIARQHNNCFVPHECGYCQKKFRKAASLTVHIRSVHTGERPYSCFVCGKTFADQRILQNHKHVHSNEFRYRCEECRVNFKTHSAFRSHQKIHENSFRCEVCSVSLDNYKTFQMHKLKHRGKLRKPLNCRYCLKDFKSKLAYSNHLHSFHKAPEEIESYPPANLHPYTSTKEVSYSATNLVLRLDEQGQIPCNTKQLLPSSEESNSNSLHDKAECMAALDLMNIVPKMPLQNIAGTVHKISHFISLNGACDTSSNVKTVKSINYIEKDLSTTALETKCVPNFCKKTPTNIFNSPANMLDIKGTSDQSLLVNSSSEESPQTFCVKSLIHSAVGACVNSESNCNSRNIKNSNKSSKNIVITNVAENQTADSPISNNNQPKLILNSKKPVSIRVLRVYKKASSRHVSCGSGEKNISKNIKSLLN